MPSTHLSLHIHIVFSTKHRRPFIVDEWRERLDAFLGGAIRAAGCIPECIGGTADHVHMLVGIRATKNIADLMRDIKHASSSGFTKQLACEASAGRTVMGLFCERVTH